MKITSPVGEISIVDEPAYTFNSADNVRRYPFTENLDTSATPCSIHGVLVDGEPVVVFGAVGGATGIHQKSAFWANDRLYLALCDRVICMQLSPFRKDWAISVDFATCFGLYLHEPTNSVVSHGELQITRFTLDGKILWQSSGRDIFTEGFSIDGELVRVVDFNGYEHRFRITDGHDA